MHGLIAKVLLDYGIISFFQISNLVLFVVCNAGVWVQGMATTAPNIYSLLEAFSDPV